MGYSKEIYEKALEVKAGQIKKAKDTYEAGLSRIRQESVEFCEIEVALAKAGSSLALAAISGETEKFDRLKDFCIEKNERKREIMTLYGVEKPGYICSLCEDSGYKDGKLCSCVTDIAKSLAFNEMSSKMPVSECCFENFDLNYYSDVADASGAVPRKRAASILKLCKDFSDNFSRDSRSLLFMGDAGLGKTHLSLAIVSAVSAKGFGVVYGSAQNLFSAAEKEHFSYGGETDAIDSLLNCDLLVIDDLGTEFYSPYTASLFYNIINSRLLSRRPTVINTNLSFDELEKRYSARITSRFIGSYDMKKFIGNDIRQIKAMG